MKVYSLTIVFNEDTDEVEYIEEELSKAVPESELHLVLTQENYERTSTIEAIKMLKDIAEA